MPQASAVSMTRTPNGVNTKVAQYVHIDTLQGVFFWFIINDYVPLEARTGPDYA